MAAYKTRRGVVLTCICGEYLLVAAKSLSDQVPFATQINESSAFLWRSLEEGADEEALSKAVLEEYEIDDPAAAKAAIRAFLDQMLQFGYLIEESEESDDR